MAVLVPEALAHLSYTSSSTALAPIGGDLISCAGSCWKAAEFSVSGPNACVAAGVTVKLSWMRWRLWLLIAVVSGLAVCADAGSLRGSQHLQRTASDPGDDITALMRRLKIEIDLGRTLLRRGHDQTTENRGDNYSHDHFDWNSNQHRDDFHDISFTHSNNGNSNSNDDDDRHDVHKNYHADLDNGFHHRNNDNYNNDNHNNSFGHSNSIIDQHVH
ncbi:hypothetical protein AK812_SmicGene32642 [Symbiodinium microadriaticum]|uniref:Uncharacterized protein n=1 Tax=Symbiodinium microadriaticum TaxID=2951 RepID=A0A1Q9CTQ2_SYMMI|nr:hypothetical protein AK812_SmicGene32642 [Symbiodinium microadriaticum]